MSRTIIKKAIIVKEGEFLKPYYKFFILEDGKNPEDYTDADFLNDAKKSNIIKGLNESDYNIIDVADIPAHKYSNQLYYDKNGVLKSDLKWKPKNKMNLIDKIIHLFNFKKYLAVNRSKNGIRT